MVTLLGFLGRLVGSIVQLVVTFVQHVALSGDPLTFLLWAVGVLLTTFAVGYFTVLALGAFVDLITPDVSAGGPPRRA